MVERFHDRTEAGRMLADLLAAYAHRPDVLVLALPRGGVPVAVEVAQTLHAPLDVGVVRKLGVPGHKELAMGAIATGGMRVLNDDIVHELGVSEATIDAVTVEEQQELERRERQYRGDRPVPDLHDRTVLLVDDGIATGATMRAVLAAVRKQGARHIAVAVPTATTSSCDEFSAEADACVCVITPEPFWAVGESYDDFAPVSDEEVRRLLDKAAHALLATPPPG